MFQGYAPAVQPLAVKLPHFARAAELPFHHRDPFDRLRAAQALEEGLTIVSDESAFKAYGVTLVW